MRIDEGAVASRVATLSAKLAHRELLHALRSPSFVGRVVVGPVTSLQAVSFACTALFVLVRAK